jgi:tetratricopeptide (TPR) repeat protein
LEINLGIVLGALDRAAEAEQHFQRAVALAPADDQAHFFYGQWLYQSGRIFDAVKELEIAVRLNPARLPSCDLLAVAYAATGDAEKAHSTAELALGIDPTDSAARAILSQPLTKSEDTWINLSLVQYRGGWYEACIESAKQALKLNPNSELAYNNIGAGYAGLQKWDLAIENERAALRIKPDFVLARNNLAWALSHKNTGFR